MLGQCWFDAGPTTQVFSWLVQTSVVTLTTVNGQLTRVNTSNFCQNLIMQHLAHTVKLVRFVTVLCQSAAIDITVRPAPEAG